MVRSCSVCENLLVLVGVQPGKAELEVMRSFDPGEIVLPLVAAPGVGPWPVPVVHADADLATAEIDSGDLVDGVGIEERRRVEALGGVPGAGVGDENVVAVLVEGGFIEQVWANLVGGVHNTGPGRNIFERPDRGIGIAGPGHGGRPLTE